MRPTVIPKEELRARFGAASNEMIEQTTRKALDQAAAEALNQHLERDWAQISQRLKAVMLPYEKLHAAMEAGCQLTRFRSWA